MFAARNALLTGSFPAFDAVGGGQFASASSLTWSHIITGNAAVAATVYESSSALTSTAKVGTTSMTQLKVIQYSSSPDNIYIALFGLLTPPTGSQTITITFSGSAFSVGNSTSYKNATSFGTAVSSSGTGSPSLSVPSGPGQIAVQAFGSYTSVDLSAYNQTSHYHPLHHSGVSQDMILGDAPGAPSVSFTATDSSAWGGVGVSVL